jgi:hypothetical protein
MMVEDPVLVFVLPGHRETNDMTRASYTRIPGVATASRQVGDRSPTALQHLEKRRVAVDGSGPPFFDAEIDIRG